MTQTDEKEVADAVVKLQAESLCFQCGVCEKVGKTVIFEKERQLTAHISRGHKYSMPYPDGTVLRTAKEPTKKLQRQYKKVSGSKKTGKQESKVNSQEIIVPILIKIPIIFGQATVVER